MSEPKTSGLKTILRDSRLSGVALIVLLLAFSWIELVYPSPAIPLHIAWLAR